MHQFRDKSVAQRELVRAGLLLYPVLQAADVLAYRAERGAGRRGPARAPRADARHRRALQRALRRGHPRRARAPDPDGRRADHATCRSPTRKMSTTGGTRGGHGLRPRRARRRSRRRSSARSPTPRPAAIAPRPTSPASRTCIEILAAARGGTPEAVEAELADARGYGDLKAAVAEAVIALLAPRRERYARDPRRRGGAGGRARRGRREGARDRARRRWPTCARRWASGRRAG